MLAAPRKRVNFTFIVLSIVGGEGGRYSSYLWTHKVHTTALYFVGGVNSVETKLPSSSYLLLFIAGSSKHISSSKFTTCNNTIFGKQ